MNAATETLNAQQQTAIDFARKTGRVDAGFNYKRDGGRFRVAASTIRSLERKGLVVCDTEIGTGTLFARPV